MIYVVNENELFVKDIFKRSYFRSYSEFYLALCMGAVLGGRGYSLNMDGMTVEADTVPKNMISYYKYLLEKGSITLSLYEKGSNSMGVSLENIKCALDVSVFGKVPVVKGVGDGFYWSIRYARESYGDYSRDFLNGSVLGNNLVHIVAYHLVDCILGGRRKVLTIEFDSFETKTPSYYINVYSCLMTLPFLKNYVDLHVDFSDTNVDIEYSIFCSNSTVASRYKPHTVGEKLDVMKKFGMVEGSILVLWSRKGMCANNPYGKISDAKIIRLDEIGDNFLGVTQIALNKTKEELLADFYDIDEDKRSIFIDMPSKTPDKRSFEIELYNLGIDTYLYDEDRFITLLDEYGTVDKLVTIDGTVSNVRMNNVNAIYWLLRQYEIDFNVDLFREMYGGSEGLLWDIYCS